MKIKIMIVGLIAVVVLAGITLVTQHRELRTLRESHEARKEFCDSYRFRVQLMQDRVLTTHQDLDVLYRQFSGPDFLKICQIDPQQLEPEKSHLNDCDVIFQKTPDYSCFERAAAKLLQAIPKDLDP